MSDKIKLNYESVLYWICAVITVVSFCLHIRGIYVSPIMPFCIFDLI